MLTLKAAGLLDVDAGEIVSPGILRIDGDRIVGVGGQPEGDIIDLGDCELRARARSDDFQIGQAVTIGVPPQKCVGLPG